MDKLVYNGKSIEETKIKALTELNCSESEVLIKELNSTSSLFKGKKVEIEVIKLGDINKFIKDYLIDLIKSMGLDVNIELKLRNNVPNITLYSSNNAILIGKNGRTIEALTILTKQVVQNEIGVYYNFVLDVGEYKIKQQKNLERSAKQLAREVADSKEPIKMDSMNSYERRIVHEALANNQYVYTESLGEEPNRYIMIKPKEK
jgi:spoIIIJ-associated protein